MKILCLAAHYPPYHNGGYGAVAHAFCEGLQSRGHTVTVITMKPEGAAVGHMPSIGVERTLDNVASAKSPRELTRFNAGNVYQILDANRRLKPDVLFSCGSDGIGFSTYQSAIGMTRRAFHYFSRPIPSLTYLGDTWLNQAWRSLPDYDSWVDFARGGRGKGFRRILKVAAGIMGRCAFGLATGRSPKCFAPVTIISQFVLDDLLSALASGERKLPDSLADRIRGLTPPARQIPFTYVPLDHAFFDAHGDPVGSDGSTSPTLRALFVSRVEKLKGPDVAIAGVAAAVKAGHDVTLTIAGMRIEDLQNELQSQAESLGIANRVTFAGTPSKPELIRLYRSHDVFLFPSRIVEGLGLVNCEAQACGLPIIGTADSGAAEVIRHEETGFRIALNDADAMGRHFGALATNPGLRQFLSTNALHSSKRFHPDRILDTLEAALLQVIREQPR